MNWLGPDVAPGEALDVDVKVRSTTPAVKATLDLEEGAGHLTFTTPQYGVSPGQAAVFYRGERLLGGGWIARPLA